MPFGSYQVSDEDAVRERDPLRQGAAADAVKLEGAGPSLSRVARDRRRGHPGHGPHRPHAAVRHQLGGFKAQGDDGGEGACAARATRARSRRPAASRSCSRPSRPPSPSAITEALAIPTIGIGAGAACDGQVLVLHDLLGLYGGFTPRFAKRYAEIGEEIRGALERFAGDVRSGAFPTEEHTYAMPAEELEAFLSSPTPPARTGT